MPLDIATIINVYVDIFLSPMDDPDFPYEIAFFSEPSGQLAILDGKIVVPPGGAGIRFKKVDKKSNDLKHLQLEWDFCDLTLHPVGPEKGKVNLKWLVGPDEIIVHDPGKGRRSFAYAIGAKLKKGGRVYFDPQLENEGGN